MNVIFGAFGRNRYLCKDMNDVSLLFHDANQVPGDMLTGYEGIADNGVTRLGTMSRYDRRFFVKSLTPQFRDIHLYRLQLRKEFKMLLELNHPGVVRVFELCETVELGLCIIMEYIGGETLSRYLERKPPRKERRRVTAALLEALEYIHRQGVVHGDLKPDNIMVTPGGEGVKLIDFGLGDSEDYALLKGGGGTPNYMSPEIAKGGAPSKSSDIYALGCILKELCPGFPYDGEAERMLRADAKQRTQEVSIIRKRAKRKRQGMRAAGAVCLIAGVCGGVRASMPNRVGMRTEVHEDTGRIDTMLLVQTRNDTVYGKNPMLESITEENATETSTPKPSAEEKLFNEKRKAMEDKLLDLAKTNLANARACRGDSTLRKEQKVAKIHAMRGEVLSMYNKMSEELMHSLSSDLYPKYLENGAIEYWDAWPYYNEIEAIIKSLSEEASPA